jgi:hypothetical protein
MTNTTQEIKQKPRFKYFGDKVRLAESVGGFEVQEKPAGFTDFVSTVLVSSAVKDAQKLAEDFCKEAAFKLRD